MAPLIAGEKPDVRGRVSRPTLGAGGLVARSFAGRLALRALGGLALFALGHLASTSLALGRLGKPTSSAGIATDASTVSSRDRRAA